MQVLFAVCTIFPATHSVESTCGPSLTPNSRIPPFAEEIFLLCFQDSGGNGISEKAGHSLICLEANSFQLESYWRSQEKNESLNEIFIPALPPMLVFFDSLPPIAVRAERLIATLVLQNMPEERLRVLLQYQIFLMAVPITMIDLHNLKII